MHIQLQLCGGKGSFLTLNTKLQSHWAFGVGFPDSGFEANSEKEILIFDWLIQQAGIRFGHGHFRLNLLVPRVFTSQAYKELWEKERRPSWSRISFGVFWFLYSFIEMIKAILVFNNHGKPRMTKFFTHYVSIVSSKRWSCLFRARSKSR